MHAKVSPLIGVNLECRSRDRWVCSTVPVWTFRPRQKRPLQDRAMGFEYFWYAFRRWRFDACRSHDLMFSATKYWMVCAFVPLVINRELVCPSGMKGTFVVTPGVGGFGTIWRTSSPVRLEWTWRGSCISLSLRAVSAHDYWLLVVLSLLTLAGCPIRWSISIILMCSLVRNWYSLALSKAHLLQSWAW